MKGAYQSPYPQNSVTIDGIEIAYVDTGKREGIPVVFLHGNPTSSYLWRNIIPHVEDKAWCLAPDLPGMGNSGLDPERHYRFADHCRRIHAWLGRVCPDRGLVLVGHDWGGALMFDWACRNPDRVRGLAYMETIVGTRSWNDFPEGRSELFRKLRGEEGEGLVRDQNFFVETVLPASIQRKLSDEEMEVYRAPFPDGESRLPTLVWPRELPIDGEPPDVVERVENYTDWLESSSVPKLFVNADPGAIIVGKYRANCRRWPNQTEVTVSGIHFVQEDSPDEIGRALAGFVTDLADYSQD